MTQRELPRRRPARTRATTAACCGGCSRYLRPLQGARWLVSFLLIVAHGRRSTWSGPYLTKVAIDRHIARGRRRRASAASRGLYLLALLLAFGVRFGQVYIMQMTGQRVMLDMRREIFGHLQRLHVGYFDRTRWAA